MCFLIQWKSSVGDVCVYIYISIFFLVWLTLSQPNFHYVW